MTTAFITRCPYCGALWRLPDAETAERGPVRCSDCRHSFDATRHLLEVPEERFSNLPAAPASTIHPTADAVFVQAPHETSAPKPRKPEEKPAAQPEAAPAPQPERIPEPEPEAASAAKTGTSDLVNEPSQVESPAADAAKAPAAGEVVKEQPSTPAAVPASDAGKQPPAAEAQESAAGAHDDSEAKVALERLHNLTPSDERTANRPDAALARIIPAKSKPQASEPQKIRVARTLAQPERVRKRHSGAFASVFTACLLLIILAATLAVIFNQKILEVFPQTSPLFHSVCSKIPCPGFYLSDISAFVVSKSNLRAVDESGNYQLEITLINGSDMPQAIPALDIELVDDADVTLMHKTLLPAEYLNNPPPKSVAPDRSITVRFSMQTNVTPARCIVKPVYVK